METDWEATMQEYKRSGMSMSDFARERGIKPNALWYQLNKAAVTKRKREKARSKKAHTNGTGVKTNGFFPVGGGGDMLEIAKGDLVVKVPTSIGSIELRRIIEAMQ